ncbi:MAG: hypothetical protein KDD40_08830, partial [Bdellovibrionales bacterium]|nr:hypothetical protein [Bdellovibrionales bacterium]
TNAAIQTQDWFLQLLTLETVFNENNRLINEINKIPVPSTLNKQQTIVYKNNLAKQILYFQQKSEQVKKKTQTFWDNKTLFNEIESDLKTASVNVRNLIKDEIKELIKIVSKSEKRQLENLIETQSDIPSIRVVNNSWKNIKQQPFSVEPIVDLIDIEKQRNSNTVIAYLDIRKSKLENRGQR